MQTRKRANGRISQRHIIINTPYQPNDAENLVGSSQFARDFVCGDELCDERGPFCPEKICACEGTVATADNEGVYAGLDEMLGCEKAAGSFAEGSAAGGAN